MVQNPTKAADLQQAGAQLVVADFDKPDTLDGALAGVERSLLLSAVDEQLVEREARFVERARKAGLRHLVKFSAIGAHPAASFTFGRQHGRSERLIMDSGLTFTFIHRCSESARESFGNLSEGQCRRTGHQMNSPGMAFDRLGERCGDDTGDIPWAVPVLPVYVAARESSLSCSIGN